MNINLKKNIRKFLSSFSLLVLDIFSYYISLFFASSTRSFINVLFPQRLPKHIFSYDYYVSIWWIPVTIFTVLFFEKLYTKRVPFWEEEKSIVKSISLSIILIFFVLVIRGLYGTISRLAILFLWFFSIFFFSIVRYFGKKLLFMLKIWKEDVIILGVDENAIKIARSFMKQKELGYNVAGFIGETNERRKAIEIDGKEIKILGNLKKARFILKKSSANVVVISLEKHSYTEITKIARNIQRYVDTVIIRPVLSDIAPLNTELHYMFFEKILLIKINNNLKSLFNQIVKVTFDYLLLILVLPVGLILIIIISIIIKCTSKGPVFIFQDRLKKGGKVFKCIKFRTMFENSDEILKEYFNKNPSAKIEWEEHRKLKSFDPRVTPVGRFLRKTSLDELPQIFNVLKGEMSFIGPRPYLVEEKKELKDFSTLILSTKPGITGLWQVSGRNEYKFKERIELEARYVENWSIWLDIIILVKTFFVILKGNGAY